MAAMALNLTAKIAGDQSGFAVSAAGDINGDGISDLMIGAYGYPAGIGKGRSYVVFGGQKVGGNGILRFQSKRQ